jgi:formylglycine-generating enzyme required for sulfatase activity
MCGLVEECYGGTLCVALQVSVPGGYAIDSTEATRSQYQAWLDTVPSTSGQPSACAWNSDFTPGAFWPPGAEGDHPVVAVDWCDAYAYCQAVGKRLCGKIGGGPNAYGDWSDPSMSQWYAACSSGGQNVYPYGNAFEDAACNGTEAAVNAMAPVGSFDACESPEGIFDLSGNVNEWEDSCEGPGDEADHYCRIRGGSFHAGSNVLSCDSGYDSLRANALEDLGFRCCSSP